VIESLVLKPGAIANYRYRADLIPTHRFPMACDTLRMAYSSTLRADKLYLRVRELVAREYGQGWKRCAHGRERGHCPLPPSERLSGGGYLDRCENVLAICPPGVGKIHLLCALGRELIIQRGRVIFCICAALAQQMLRTKQELRLPARRRGCPALSYSLYRLCSPSRK